MACSPPISPEWACRPSNLGRLCRRLVRSTPNFFALDKKRRYRSAAHRGASLDLPMIKLARTRPAGRRTAVAATASLFLCMLLAGAALGDGIGSPVIVVNNVTGRLKTEEPRVLHVGVDVFADEAVKTAEKSVARIVFQDQTKLEIGALSEVVLDRFVYDPNRSDSEVAVSIAKGIARFTTGVLQHESYKVNTPAATIGVRGTILDMRVDERGTWVYVENGSVTVTANGVTIVVNAGQATFAPVGGTPSAPTRTASVPFDITGMYALLWDASASGIITSLTQFNTGAPLIIQNNCVSRSSSACN
jgi:ferric-dicitrate binding protein FerR (iron transport regulator)